MKPSLCWLLGHSRGPAADTLRYHETDPTAIRICGCCGRPAHSFSLVRSVESSRLMPRGYGLAWVHMYADRAVFLPVPFNLIAAAARQLWFWIKRGGRNCAVTPREAYEDGYRQALRDAQDAQQ